MKLRQRRLRSLFFNLIISFVFLFSPLDYMAQGQIRNLYEVSNSNISEGRVTIGFIDKSLYLWENIICSDTLTEEDKFKNLIFLYDEGSYPNVVRNLKKDLTGELKKASKLLWDNAIHKVKLLLPVRVDGEKDTVDFFLRKAQSVWVLERIHMRNVSYMFDTFSEFSELEIEKSFSSLVNGLYTKGWKSLPGIDERMLNYLEGVSLLKGGRSYHGTLVYDILDIEICDGDKTLGWYFLEYKREFNKAGWSISKSGTMKEKANSNSLKSISYYLSKSREEWVIVGALASYFRK